MVDSISGLLPQCLTEVCILAPEGSSLSAMGILSECCGNCVYTHNKAALKPLQRARENYGGKGDCTCAWAVKSGALFLSHSEPLTDTRFVWSMNIPESIV